jgi:hypothetical protein
VVVASYRNTAEDLGVSRLRLGIFTIEDKRGTVDLSSALPETKQNLEVKNQLTGEPIRISEGRMMIPAEPVVLDIM